MRCLTLADALVARGGRVRFVCRHLPESLHELIDSRNHEVTLLPASTSPQTLDELPHAAFLETSQNQDVVQTRTALSAESWDWLIVDHYGLDVRWESALRAVARRIMVIDDVADRNHDCDVLLDQNIYPNMHARYTNRVPSKCRQLLGPGYALLREEFRKLRAQVAPRTGPMRRVLVLFGGVDPCDLTSRVLVALTSLDGPALSADVVVGADHPRRTEIQAYCEKAGYTCYVQTNQVAELMARADLALGAGGSATWERCCLGVATICASFADNQYHIASALEAAGACIFLGDESAVTPAGVAAVIADLRTNHERLVELSARAFALVDGEGAPRVCDALAECA